MNAENFLQPHLRTMQPYTPIVPFEVLSQRLGISASEIVKLDANENLYGPSPRALEAMAHADKLHIYPDPDQAELRSAIADYIGVPMAHILCGAGADEIIQIIGQAFIQPGDGIVDLPPTFGMYKWIADVMNASYISVPRGEAFSLDLAAIEATLNPKPKTQNPKLIFVTNPNNPDGSTIDDATLKRLLALPLVVVLDEAYIDFSSQPSRAGWVQHYPNLIVMRTFSKLLGMAGMRIGYGIFPLEIIKHLWKIKQPYTPTVASSIGAVAALQDREHLRDNVQRIVQERQRMGELLSNLGWLHVYLSETNFLLCRVTSQIVSADGATPGKRVKTYLEQKGILVRYFDKDGLRDCFRVSIGKPEHTDKLIHALKII
jgi:histidinol-phosphate aminotransferase